MQIFYFIIIALFLIGLQIAQDWLVYKMRGRAQPDDPQDENPPVITGPQDARAQRYLDIFSRPTSKSSKGVDSKPLD